MPSVPGYTHTPGHHCGSTALRNLLGFHGAEISEEMAFGLGAGACFYYVALEDASPTRWFNGRTARLEENFRELTGAALELRTFDEGDDEAWEAARAEVDAGNPALLLTDLYYLDHYGNSAHFPGHAVVLAGYDDEFAHLSDTGFEELQTTTRLENLDRARHSGHPAYPLAGPHVHRLRRRSSQEQLARGDPGRDRARRQGDGRIRVRRVLRPRRGRAPRRRGRQPGPRSTEDWQWCARFGYQVIERRGTGGGAFRLMYSRFLEEARPARGAPRGRGRRPLDRPGHGLPCRQRARRARPGPLARDRRCGPHGRRGRAPALDHARRLVVPSEPCSQTTKLFPSGWVSSKLGERLDETGKIPTREPSRMNDDQTMVLTPGLSVFVSDRFKVTAVVGGNSPPLRLSDLEDIRIAEPRAATARRSQQERRALDPAAAPRPCR